MDLTNIKLKDLEPNEERFVRAILKEIENYDDYTNDDVEPTDITLQDFGSYLHLKYDPFISEDKRPQ